MTSEPQDINQKLAAEQAAIAVMTDSVEQVYAKNRLVWWVKALKGEKGSAEEFDKATRKLTDYRNQKLTIEDLATAPEWFLNSTRAAEWILQQGYFAKKGGGLLTLHAARKFVDTLRKDKTRGFHIDIVRRAADNKYGCPTKIEEAKESAPLGIQLQEAILRKNLADADNKEMDVEHNRRKLSNNWAHRSEVYTTWAAIMGDLYTAITHNNSYNLGHIITLVKGDQNKAPHLDDFLAEINNKSFNEVGMMKRVEGCFTSEEIEIEHLEEQ
jgi:hypothetical protein